MAPKVIAIRWLTDEGGAQPRVASKRVRGLPGAAYPGAGVYFMAARSPAQPRVATKRVRGLQDHEPVTTSGGRSTARGLRARCWARCRALHATHREPGTVVGYP